MQRRLCDRCDVWWTLSSFQMHFSCHLNWTLYLKWNVLKVMRHQSLRCKNETAMHIADTSNLPYSRLQTQSMNQAKHKMFLYKKRENLFIFIVSQKFLSWWSKTPVELIVKSNYFPLPPPRLSIAFVFPSKSSKRESVFNPKSIEYTTAMKHQKAKWIKTQCLSLQRKLFCDWFFN